MRKRGKVISMLLFAALLCCPAAWSQEEAPAMVKGKTGVTLATPVDRVMCADEGIAVDGYDLISYREPGGPVAGNPDYSADHAGFTYLFSSAENLTTFLDDPERYVPSYHGFCAVTLALGRVVCPDSTNFVIQGDRLFLFEVTGFTNGRTLWNTDPATFRGKADRNFGSLTIQ